MLTEQQLAEFDRTGILKFEGAFGARDAGRMRDVIWNELRHRYEIERDDPTTWDRHEPTGMKSSKRSQAFQPICSPVVEDALDSVLGVGRWDRPKTYGNVLITMPNAETWRVPHRIWHSDFEPFFPRDEVFAVKLWALVDDVDPGGGGTPQLAGSHKLFARHLEGASYESYVQAKLGFLKSHPYLVALTRADDDPKRSERFMATETDVDGLPARVIECTGTAGDVYLTHAWVHHSIAVNATARPRLMRSVAIYRKPAASDS